MINQMAENIDRCNAYCDPDRGIHATVGYGGRLRFDYPTRAGLHGVEGSAKVLVFEEAVEVPPPDHNPELMAQHEKGGSGPWLVVLQFSKTGT